PSRSGVAAAADLGELLGPVHCHGRIRPARRAELLGTVMTTTRPGPKTAADGRANGAKPAPAVVKKALGEVDSRFGTAGFLKRNLNKVFPDHWSFMLGEIALYSIVILLLTGTFLTFFFRPGTNEVIYQGHYIPLRGLKMTEAFESTLRISF